MTKTSASVSKIFWQLFSGDLGGAYFASKLNADKTGRNEGFYESGALFGSSSI